MQRLIQKILQEGGGDKIYISSILSKKGVSLQTPKW